MAPKHNGSRLGHLSVVGRSRAAEAQALKAAHAIARSKGREGEELQTQVPSFLAANPAANTERKTREQLVAEAAYLRAAGRGFEPGHELEDWLAAEKAVDAELAGR